MKKSLFLTGLLSLGLTQNVALAMPTEDSYQYNSSLHQYTYDELIDLSGYVKLSYESINLWIMTGTATDWLGFGIRAFEPYEKTEDYWTWRIPKVAYKGLTVIGVYRGVCDISGQDGCGWAGSVGLIFEQDEAQLHTKKLKIAKGNVISSRDFMGVKRAVINFSPDYE